MHVCSIHADNAGNNNPFKRSLDSLIASVGTAAFESDLFCTAREATGCEHLTAYAVDSDGKRRILLAANPGDEPVARHAGEVYVSRFWDADPANQLFGHCETSEVGLLARPSPCEIRDSQFRRSCYSSTAWSQTGAQMIDRVSLFKRHRGQTIKLSFHRAVSAGPFRDSEIDNIADSANVLIALIGRHQLPITFVMRRGMRARCVRAVRAVAPELSEREAEVCAGIVLGATSEAIALELNISVNTVRTYRKRAYSRLHISSQNELMHLVLPYVAAETEEAGRS